MKINLQDFNQDFNSEVSSFERIKKKTKKLQDKLSVKEIKSSSFNEELSNSKKFNNQDLEELYNKGYITDVLFQLKSGKEATVYLAKNSEKFIAVKIYTDLRVRNFRNDGIYREGRFIGSKRIEKAIDQGTEKGLDAHQILWVQEEFRQMKILYNAGIPVPKPIAYSGLAILMEFIGDDIEPASRLSEIKLSYDLSQEAFRQSIKNLGLILSTGRIHGDYSTYNLLWKNQKVIVIDFPQVIEVGNNINSEMLLQRDVNSLCKSFKKLCVKSEPETILKQVKQIALKEGYDFDLNVKS